LFEHVPTAGGRLRYRRARGPGPHLLFGVDGPNVLEQYDGLFRTLEGRADVTAFEPPGTGGSKPARGFPFTLSALAKVTREVVEALALEPVTLVFPCYLGFVAQLLPYDSVTVQTPSWMDMARWAERVDRKRILRRPVLGQLVVRLRREALARLWYRTSAGDAEQAARLTGPAVEVLRRGGSFCLASLMQGMEREPFTGGNTPRKVIWGDRDRSHRGVQLPHAVHLDCGHSPELEQPAVFVDTLLS
jgi:pimeloyl-ACP methyl ester carboxylesterase